MVEDNILKAIFNYGFPSAMLVALSIGGWRMMNRIMTNNKEREDRQAMHNKDREDKLMLLIQNQVATFNSTLLSSIEQIVEFRRANDEAHRYQREEYKNMLERLDHLRDHLK